MSQSASTPSHFSPAGRNWAGNLVYSARMAVAPRSLTELKYSLEATAGPVKFLGSRHCFNTVADTTGTMMLMEYFEQGRDIEVLDTREDGTAVVRVRASIPYGELALALDARGYALAHFASLPHITVGGAIATGTHGSGNESRPLIGAIRALEFVSVNGEIHRAARDGSGDIPFGVATHLGLIGALTFVEIDVEPQFNVVQTVFERLPWDALSTDFDQISGAGFSVSLFTRWEDDWLDQVWLKQRVNAGHMWERESFFGAVRASGKRHPLPGVDPVHCTEQEGKPGPSFERLPHFKLGFTPSNGDELQSEYIIPRSMFLPALQAVRGIADTFKHVLFISEVRTMAADDTWLAPSPEDSVAIHFTWKPMQAEVEAVIPHLESVLEPFNARAHWGKLHTFRAEKVAELYPHLNDFLGVCRELDPQGRLRNEYSARVLGY